MFALLITLVIYIKFLKIKSKSYFELKSSLANFLKFNGITYTIYNQNYNIFQKDRENTFNSNFKFLKELIKDLNIDLSILFTERVSNSSNIEDINALNRSCLTIHKNLPDNPLLDYEILFLSKILEFYMMEKYNKDLNGISETLNKIEISDMIIDNLFVNEDIYDLINHSYKKIKEKYFWNFSEIIYSIYMKHPRILKYTILRHLKYCPSQESLLNQLVQYYYENKDFKKCKSIIRVYFFIYHK